MGLIGCGYTLQGAGNRLTDREGIRRIYVSPMVNNTYKPGVENLVYNQLIKAISSSGRISLVQEKDQADATMSGSIGQADYAISTLAATSSLFPQGVGSPDLYVATVYTANLGCSFTLTARHPRPKQNAALWSGSFSRSKQFPANNQLDVVGTTSALINESEFDRTLKDLAQRLMDDVTESMLNMF